MKTPYVSFRIYPVNEKESKLNPLKLRENRHKSLVKYQKKNKIKNKDLAFNRIIHHLDI